MKKAVSVILSIIMSTFIFVLSTPVAFAASYNGSCGSGIQWVLDTSEGVLTISGYGEMEDYSLSETPGWDRYQNYVKSVVFDNGITYVGAYSFYNGGKGYKYKKLTSVDFGSVDTIGDYAFRGCSAISSLTDCGSVTAIGENAFRSCVSLPSFDFSGVETIGSGAFYGCNGIQSVSIPPTVTDIGSIAFEECDSVESVSIPRSVETIGDRAFAGCDSVNYIYIDTYFYISIGQGIFNGTGSDSGVTLDVDNRVRAIPAEMFSYCRLTSLQNGEGLETFNSNCFAHTEFTNFHVGEMVSDIKPDAFADCVKLQSFSVSSENQYYSSDSDGVLLSKLGNQIIRYPSGRTAVRYTLPSNIEILTEGAFRECRYLQEFSAGASTTTDLSSRCFENCPSLTTVDLGSIKYIGTYAFLNCSSLSNITMNNVIQISTYAFAESDAISAFPSAPKLKLIGDYAFYGCEGLINLSIPSGVTSIGKYAFFNCKGLVSVSVPSTVSTINEGAFSFCSSLNSVSLANGIATIGQDAFLDCNALTTIRVPASVTSIGKNAIGFKYASNGNTINPDFTALYCYSGSYARTYAVNNHVPYTYITDSVEETEITIDGGTSGTLPADKTEEQEFSLDSIADTILSFDYIGFLMRVISFIISVLRYCFI